MSNISQFFGGAPRRILRGATEVQSTANFLGEVAPGNLFDRFGWEPARGVINTGVFVDPVKSTISSSYSGNLNSRYWRSAEAYITLEGNGAATISNTGEILVYSGKGVAESRSRSSSSTFEIKSSALVYWEVLEY